MQSYPSPNYTRLDELDAGTPGQGIRQSSKMKAQSGYNLSLKKHAHEQHIEVSLCGTHLPQLRTEKTCVKEFAIILELEM